MDRHSRDNYKNDQGSRRPDKTYGHETMRPPRPPPLPRPPKPKTKTSSGKTASHDLGGETPQVAQYRKDTGHEAGSNYSYGSSSSQGMQSHEPYQHSQDSFVSASHFQGNYQPQPASDAQFQRRSNYDSNPSPQRYASYSPYTTGGRSISSRSTSSLESDFSRAFAPSWDFCRHRVPSQQCTSCRHENDYR
ncbi:hypothetical protein N7G274_006547 [Stereocaulon virgatum]|uniref:Uncharacterized protein n=1 Tax=Stereocaulon virgatum TaxID=373712 RepID=A0ABR4AB40_9LECA